MLHVQHPQYGKDCNGGGRGGELLPLKGSFIAYVHWRYEVCTIPPFSPPIPPSFLLLWQNPTETTSGRKGSSGLTVSDSCRFTVAGKAKCSVHWATVAMSYSNRWDHCGPGSREGGPNQDLPLTFIGLLPNALLLPSRLTSYRIHINPLKTEPATRVPAPKIQVCRTVQTQTIQIDMDIYFVWAYICVCVCDINLFFSIPNVKIIPIQNVIPQILFIVLKISWSYKQILLYV